jgi:hypothetical protein
MLKVADKRFLNIKDSVVDEHVLLVAVFSIHHRGGGRCHVMKNNKEVKREIGKEQSITLIFSLGC